MTATSRETVVRFGLRALLGSTAAIAVFFGAATPALRGWSVPERQAFFTVWAAAFVTGIGFLFSYCILRLRAERRAGPVYLVLPLSNARRRYLAAAFLAVATVGLLVGSSLIQQRQARLFVEMNKQGGTIQFSPLWSIPAGIGIGMPLAMICTVLWWRTCRVELCESGIVYSFSFIPWSSISYRLEEQPPLLTVNVVANRFSNRLRAVVPGEMLERVREILKRQIKG